MLLLAYNEITFTLWLQRFSKYERVKGNENKWHFTFEGIGKAKWSLKNPIFFKGQAKLPDFFHESVDGMMVIIF